MLNHSVHMRDQKANQMAMLAKSGQEALINLIEEITLVIVIWGMFFLASLY